MTSLHVPLDYYAYGKVNSVPQFNQFASNMGIKDTSSNLLERNALSINSSKLEHLRGSYKQIHSLHESNPKGNNYMNPIQSFNSQEKYSIKPDMTNIETFRIARSKHFATDRSSDIQSGVKCTKEEFIQAKNDQVIGKHANLPCINETKKLNDNSLVFDKTNKSMIRYPKGFWGFCPE